jgi:hypothetical protein
MGTEPESLAERLSKNRQRFFVGRELEKAALEAFAMADNTQSGIVTHLCAPSGVGKTTLLKSFIQDTQYPHPILWLDARDIPADLAAFAGAVSALRAQFETELSQPHLLIIDNFEYLDPLEAWLRETFISEQPVGFRLILATQKDPALEWRTDPMWVNEHQYIVLSPFSLSEVREYLLLRNIDEANLSNAQQFSHGNPLALALFIDSSRQHEADTINLAQSWRQRLVSNLDDKDQQRALEACCIVRHLDESMLARMLERKDVTDLFQWLQSQSYIETSSSGLLPHNLLRQSFIDNLKRSDPRRLIQLGDRAFSTIHDRIEHDVGDHLSLIQDAFFLLKDVSTQQIESGPEEQAVYVDTVHSTDWPVIDEMVRRYENNETVTLLKDLHDAQPQGLRVVRDGAGKAIGFFQILRVDLLPPALLNADPVSSNFLKIARESIKHAGTVFLNRFWLHRDHDMEASSVYLQAFSQQAFLAASACPAVIGSRQANTPQWRAASARFGHLEANFGEPSRNGAPAMFIYQDLSADNKAGMRWLRQTYRQALGLSGPTLADNAKTEKLPDQETFQRALRQAFRDATRLDRLQTNALLTCHLLAQNNISDNPLQRAQALKGMLEQTCNDLETLTTTQPLANVLVATYLKPAPSQQAAADRLSLSYATYRRRLTEALKLVSSEWWAKEFELRNS